MLESTRAGRSATKAARPQAAKSERSVCEFPEASRGDLGLHLAAGGWLRERDSVHGDMFKIYITSPIDNDS